MTFSKNAFYFNKKKVRDYQLGSGIQDTDIAYRFRTDYDGAPDEIPNMLQEYLNDPKLAEVDSLVIGMWAPEHDDGPETVINLLLEHKAKLQHFKGMFFGDIIYEENEVSWIENSDYGAFLNAFPNLEFFQVRGGNGLGFKNLSHPKLKKLVVQSGGLSTNVLQDIASANLPQLEHLELWLGSEWYGFNAKEAKEVQIAYQGTQAQHLPNLKYLGLRNSEMADDLAEALQGDPILERIEELDLSRGNLSDRGAKALVNNPSIKNLKKLHLGKSYINSDWVDQLKNLGIKVDLKDNQPGVPEDDRYISVSE